jgi:hypothetical protein
VDSEKAETTRSEACQRESQRPGKETNTEIAIIDNRVDRYSNGPNENTNEWRPTSDMRLNAKADSPTLEHADRFTRVSDRREVELLAFDHAYRGCRDPLVGKPDDATYNLIDDVDVILNPVDRRSR